MKKIDSPIYLDNNSTTQMDERVFDSMKPYFLDVFGNASSKTHSYGWDAEFAVEKARKEIARLISCQPREIFFTSGGTEGNNLLLLGLIKHGLKTQKKVHIVSTQIEHRAVLDVLKNSISENVEITFLKPDNYGLISPTDIQNHIKENTICVSVIYANNEIGVIQNISEIGLICKNNQVFFHTDAVQALAYEDINVQEMNIDLMTMTAHKIHGPKGVGAVFIRHAPERVALSPIFFGGSQEKALRPGTLNVPGIVGFGEACRILNEEKKIDKEKIEKLKNTFLLELLKIPYLKLNGHPTKRLANNLSLTFGGIHNSNLIRELKSLAFSTGSACSSDNPEPSHVLKAIGLSDEECISTIRIGLSKFTTSKDLEIALNAIKDVSARLKMR